MRGIEVDVLPIGDRQPGDAILLRYGNLEGQRDEQTVVLIDGGYTGDGQAVLSHLTDVYLTDELDFVVNTHPDHDHIAGLNTMLEEARVGYLLMHDPDNCSPLLWRGSALETSMPLLAHLEKSLNESRALLETAARNRVQVVQPFTGLTAGSLRVLGPTEAYYSELYTAMTREPWPERATAHGERELILKHAAASYSERQETLLIETLPETGGTAPSNNTSVISLLTYGGFNILFTGDAGAPALRRAISELHAQGVGPGDLHLVQVPHHGSRYNVTPSVLDSLLGPITDRLRGVSFVSVPESNPTLQFPTRQVSNAFRRRGYPVLDTAGRCLTFTFGEGDSERAEDLDPVDPLPLHPWVHDFDN